MAKIKDLNFKNKFANLGEGFYTQLSPTGFANPFLVSFNKSAAEEIGIDANITAKTAIEYFSGQKPLPGATSLASVYAGHQFGSYVPQLGDGRAIMVGEANGYEIQLKGSGKTPYSRFGDGRAVLRSTIREYLCSEAMHSLGIPTTRALCIIGSDEDIQRETVEKAAMLTRLSPSHIRFGHFEYFFYTGQHDKLRELADFTIANYYEGHNYENFFEQVVIRTAGLIAKWQAYGFAYGVMNTDNMSILGLTIDYGPFGFMEAYNPGYICNHSDYSGRYAFDQQPSIGLWNLYALAQSLSPLISTEALSKIIQKYQPVLVSAYSQLMRHKLGLETEEAADQQLVKDILDLLAANQVDYTNFFRKLSSGLPGLRDEFLDRGSFDNWHKTYRNRRLREGGGGEKLMLQANPKYILRNYLAETAIREASLKHEYKEITTLLAILQKPYDEQPEMDNYAKEPPEWGKHLEVSCSS